MKNTSILTNISIRPQKDGLYISPLLFGHNIEHTRSCLWKGLSAQLIRNRKFSGKPQQLKGLAMDWYPIGPSQTYFLLDSSDSYTRHYTKEKRHENELHSQYIQGCAIGKRCGIGQDDLSLEKGHKYNLRLALKSEFPLPITLDVMNNNRAITIASFEEKTVQKEWKVVEYQFIAQTTELKSRLEITFQGPGDLRVGFVSLLPSNNFHGMREDVVRLLEEIGSPILRWPGGNFAGDYRWQDGLLDPDTRAPLNTHLEVEMLPHTFGFDFHEMGTDEFIALCQRLGSESFISINLGWDSVQECASWVEYCNGADDTKWGKHRVDRGHKNSYNVKYWSLGNELGHGHMIGPNDAKTYAVKALAYAKAMKAIDSSIVLVMSGDWREEEWFLDGLPPLASEVDYISYHQYDDPLLSYLHPKTEAEFKRLINEPCVTQKKIKSIREKIEQVVPNNKFIGISYDEWNVWYTWYRIPGVAEGIHAAKMLNFFVRNSISTGIFIGCYFEPINEGAIVVDTFTSRLTPAGKIFSLYKAHHGMHLIDASSATTDNPIDWIASKNKDNNKIVFTVINSETTQESVIQLQIEGHVSFSLDQHILLTSTDFMPASIFNEKTLVVEKHGNAILNFKIPKHSIAHLVFDLSEPM